jgi:hypothetical protein
LGGSKAKKRKKCSSSANIFENSCKALKALDSGVKIKENCKDSPRNVNRPEALVTTATKLNNAKLTIRKISRMVPQIPPGYKVQSRGFTAWLGFGPAWLGLLGAWPGRAQH